VLRTRLVPCVLLLGSLAASPCRAADPPLFLNPLKGFVRSPFSAELELYSGGITGKSIGEAYQSATRGDYGVRFTFGFLKALNLSLNYMYSNQSRSFTAVTPASGTLPTGTALMRARNLAMGWGNGEINLVRFGRSTFYLSPGIGFVRNGSRDVSVITPLGTATSHILPGTAVTFNLGAGFKVFPFKHFGLRFDVRDHLSGGGTGNLSPQQNLVISPPCTQIYPLPAGCGPVSVPNPAQYFGPIPVQNNFVFTLGLIFKLL
jgi:hypothetical protein